MGYEALVSGLTRGIELVGIAVLLLGALLSSAVFAGQWRREGFEASYSTYRANLGRAILLGLEILIIADIIGTIAVEPTLENLGVLALIVVIRTFLSFALEVEISGRLPWRHPAPGDSVTSPVK
jgi:uncharacterized membrane protein